MADIFFGKFSELIIPEESLKENETLIEKNISREKKSNNKMSVIITAMKIIMISEKKNMSGLKIPFLATSIIPLEKTDPTATPKLE